MTRVLRPRTEFPTPAFRVLAPLLAAAAVALAQAVTIEDHGVLWAGAFLAAMLVASPLLLLVRRVVPWALAATALAVTAQCVALGVWASSVAWG
jgi:hypothetical protein